MALTKDGPPTQELHTLIASALGKEPIDWHRPHTGLSAASFVVGFADGSSAFVKAAVDDQGAKGSVESMRSSPVSIATWSLGSWPGSRTAIARSS